MKNFLSITFFAAVVMFMVACGGETSGEKVEAGEAQEVTENAAAASLAVDVAASSISWEGTKKIGDDKHTGTLALTEGALKVEGDNVVGGSFTIDLNSMASTDLEGDYADKLVGHLKSADFFDTEKYPTATFEITKVIGLEGDSTATHIITGNLTMKETTNSISFKANVENGDAGVTATSQQFKIDRTAWNVMYGSEKSIGSAAQDKIINDELGIQISLAASK